LPVIVTVLESPADTIGCIENHRLSEVPLFQDKRRRGVSRKKEKAAAGGEETSRGEGESGGATAEE
jgi:hypothetical protein